MQTFVIACGSAEIATALSRAAQSLGLSVDPQLVTGLADFGATELAALKDVDGWLFQDVPALDVLVTHLSARDGFPIGLLSSASPLHSLLPDLGFPVASSVRAFAALLVVFAHREARPWESSLRALSSLDRRWLSDILVRNAKSSLASVADGLVAVESVVAGEARDVRDALLCCLAASGPARPPMPRVKGVERRRVEEVILGPRRALSDPASKLALDAYDLPLPVEELCGSASRAASEAARIGFPVRLALASPDLRIWDHPDLAIDGVDNAARVRDVFRQMTSLAKEREAGARILGVTVTAEATPRALLRAHVRSVSPVLAHLALGFADPHGAACNDETHLLLPCSIDSLASALKRLQGAPLLLDRDARRLLLPSLHDALQRLGVFVHDFRDEVEEVTVQPLAVLYNGEVELREVCIQVSDAFERSLKSAQ